MITRRQFVMRGGLLVPAAGLLTSNVRAANYLPQRRKAFRSGWTPGSLSGLQIWLKSASISGVDGDAVATWPDSSGNGRDLTQATAGSRPTLKTGLYNGQSCVRFDAVDDRLSITSQNLSATWGITNAVTSWFVTKTADTGNGRTYYWTSSAGNNDFGVWHRFGTSVYFDCGSLGGGGRISGAVSQNSNLKAIVYHRDAANGTVYQNGTSVLSSSSFSDSLDSGTGTFTVPNEPYAFDLCELGVVSRALTSDERTSLNSYLRTTYGTP